MHQLTFEDIDGLGRGMFAAAGLKPNAPPKRGAVEAVRRLRGPKTIYTVSHATVPADTAIAEGRQLIMLRDDLPAPSANYYLAEMLSRIQLGEQSWFRALPLEDQRDIAKRVGGWLVAPDPALQASLQAYGFDLGAIANRHSITQTCALLRTAEMGGPDAGVVTDTRVYARGPRFSSFAGELRGIAARKSLQTMTKIPIRDQVGRVGLLARAA